MRNVHRRAPQPYFPLQKTVSTCRILQSNLLIISLWNQDPWSWPCSCSSSSL
jgi:hypothetical protein